MKVLVTGGSGFVGHHLVKRLTDDGHDVINLDINPDKTDSGEKFVSCDITNQKVLFPLFKKEFNDIDAIIHLAAKSEKVQQKESKENPELFFKENVQGTFNLLRAATFTNAKTFLFPSSYLVYGEPKYLPVDESHILKPQSFYASTKVYGEELCNTFSEFYGLNTISLRKCNIYGTGDTTKRVITLFIERAKEGKDITVLGNKILDFVYVGDVVDAYIKALNYGKSDVFNIGSGKGTSLIELADIVKTVINPEIKIIKTPSKTAEVKNFISDITKAKKLLNFKPNCDIRSFIEKYA